MSAPTVEPLPPRQRIIDAALEAIRRDGLQSLTTVALAKAARIRQPNFYAYFKNIDDCLAEAARFVGQKFHEIDSAAFVELREAIESGRPYMEISCRYHEQLLHTILDEPEVSSLFLRYRYDDSPFGQVLQTFEQQQVDRVLEHLWDWAARLGIAGRHVTDVRLLAELQVAAVMTAALAVLEGRITDRCRAAAILAYNADATTRATFRRLLEEDGRRERPSR